jgi:uncharacterized protein (TIGR03435 family)
MTVARESDGIQIDLKTGDIIVTVLDPRDGPVYVRTKDMTIAVNGTVFLVNAGRQGSRVAVIDGEARVRERDMETRLRAGEQVTTSPTIAQRPLAEDIAWSRHAAAHRAVLAAFQKGISDTAGRLEALPQAAATAQGGAGAPATTSQGFEEASVRPCDPDNLPERVGDGRGGSGPNSVYMTPGRFYALCLTPATLIRIAYGYRSWNQEVDVWFMDDLVPGGRTFQQMATGSVSMHGVEDGRRVRGGPDWMRTERYTIEAVARVGDGQDACTGTSKSGRSLSSPKGPCYSANAASMSGPMLLALLERRFGLKAHVETEQTPAYSLVVAPGGLKMKEGACTGAPRPVGLGEAGFARWQLDLVRRNLDAARRGDETTGSCGTGVADNGPNRIFLGAGAGKPPLQGALGVPVFDRTGIPNTTRFNYALEFLVGQTRNPFFDVSDDPLQMAADSSSVQPAPNLFTALEQQLGLRLEPMQVPRQYIVIDAIQRPEAN